ncbi:MAG: CZB domain-containing protein [Novosphingobium sp.]
MQNAALVDEINNAIGAHGAWKMRLRTAIASGRGDVSAADARCDDKCSFGKWLYGPCLDAQAKADLPYRVVKRLHGEFHRAAGDILAHVEHGNMPAAAAAMEGDYAEQSDKLVRALAKWKHEVLHPETVKRRTA